MPGGAPTRNEVRDGYHVHEQAITQDDWDIIEDIIAVLKPLRVNTKRLERQQCKLVDWVPICNRLMDDLHQFTQRFKQESRDRPEYQWLAICAEAAYDKLYHYYCLCEQSPAYYGAIALDPALKYEWFHQH